tara:strand:- start:147 stop:611 length:465 start_codon:yes stop_codon:yes gene_type:complete
MICKVYCFIAIVLFVTNVYVTLSTTTSNANHDFYVTLTPDLIARYKKIIAERAIIYTKGMAIGIIIGVLSAILMKENKSLHFTCKLCLVAAVTFVVTCFTYLAHPKSDYIVPHLTSRKQKEAWIKCYRSYQISYITGLILGGASAMFFAGGLCL